MALSLILAAQMAAATGPQLYRCLDDTMFTLSLSQDQAIVRFKDGQYVLPRKQSAIALKYATPTATLYLDGDFAAFVADDRPLPGCTRVTPVAKTTP
jgi:hypothetical protein